MFVILSGVRFKIAEWRSYWIFRFFPTLIWFCVYTKTLVYNLYVRIEACWFSTISLTYKMDACQIYRQVSNIRHTKSTPTLKMFSYCLVAVFSESLEARCQVENEDVVGAAPTGDAPTTSEWSTILWLTKVCLILEVLRYCFLLAE